MEEKWSSYNLDYMDVYCSAVQWRYKKPSIFKFIYKGKDFIFYQRFPVDAVADTDHIRCVIEEQFLPWYEQNVKWMGSRDDRQVDPEQWNKGCPIGPMGLMGENYPLTIGEGRIKAYGLIDSVITSYVGEGNKDYSGLLNNLDLILRRMTKGYTPN